MGSMGAFADEFMKIASVVDAGKAAVPFLKSYGKPLGLLAGGATGYHLGKKELDKYMLGRQVYDQMQAQQGA